MMEKLFTIEDYELWNIILDGPNISIKLDSKGREVPKERSEFNDIDLKLMEKITKAKKILIYDLGPDEYNQVLACTKAKEIWDTLKTAH